MFPAAAARVVLVALLLLPACENEEPVTCSTALKIPPRGRVSLRDADTRTLLCDATVEMRLLGDGPPVRLNATPPGAGECAYTGDGPTLPAVITVEREGYQRTTQDVTSNGPGICGDTPEVRVEMSLKPLR